MERRRAPVLLALLLAACREPASGTAAPRSRDGDAPPAPVASDGASPSTGRVLPAPVGSSPSVPGTELTWTWPEVAGLGTMVVVVAVPPRTHPGERFPLLIAFHGKGEALKGPRRGARGWLDDYALGRALARLAAPPLTPEDFEGHVTKERLAAHNRRLHERPFRGLVVATPYTPDILSGGRSLDAAAPMARFVEEELLPRLRRETPVEPSPSTTAIDGVSLGGRMALLVGLARPQLFGSVGALQPAFDTFDAAELGRRAARAHRDSPRTLFHLLSSEGDYFLVPTRAIARAFEREAVPVSLLIVPGPHDYSFNRGPGALEMLLHHEDVLRRR